MSVGWQQADDADLRELSRKHPGWLAWRGVCGLLHARLVGEPTMQVKGEDLTDLRDQIVRTERLRDAGISK